MSQYSLGICSSDLQDTATSYGFGALGSLVYLRMLNRSMDGVGGVGAALGQPRLLVPVILTAAFNRSETGHFMKFCYESC